MDALDSISSDGDGVTHGWRDIALELQGPTVDALSGSFERMWALAAFDPSSLRDFARANPPPDGDVSAPALLLTGPGSRTADLRRQLHADLHTAFRVTVHAVHFLPSRELGRMLADVALRGKARILIRRLGSVAIRFFEYLPQMMHGKLLVVDDVVYVGSANLDVRSRLINYELMLRLPVPALAEQARSMFDADLQHSRPILMPTSSWWQRLRQRAAYGLLKRVDPYIARRKLRMLQ